LIKNNIAVIEKEVEKKLYVDIKERIKTDFIQQENNHNKNVKLLTEKLVVLNRRIGSTEGNLKAELKKLKDEVDAKKNKNTIDVAVKKGNKTIDLGTQHSQFENLLKYVQAKVNVYLVGSAGSGKTSAAKNIAKALDIPFYFTGAIASEFKLTGFINAQGTIVSTEFRKAYESGGLFLFDEIDASYPQAILAFNAALANDFMDFPDKKIERHKNFYCIAAANTYGSGADREYIGRNQLDAASLDRFVFFDWNIDEDLERELANNDTWVNYVQKVRKTAKKLGIRFVISPRASFYGATLIATGIDRKEVEKNVLWKGLDEATVQQIKNNL
ncbi:AAA family ATPase, partial [Flavobacterium psychrophilum]|nr:AAA family ATPase [Flavobacterium psychrophilum]EKT4535423.1 AAA family ATPase [Flavobacterium psychrophilum]EKT4537854.1 AAA family ATPase [Flavobacterium psychrophilum]EKT4572017.1 AAA family ATPase [Flavobacterium psychrophilum]